MDFFQQKKPHGFFFKTSSWMYTSSPSVWYIKTYWEIFDLKFVPLHCGPQLISLKKFSFFCDSRGLRLQKDDLLHIHHIVYLSTSLKHLGTHLKPRPDTKWESGLFLWHKVRKWSFFVTHRCFIIIHKSSSSPCNFNWLNPLKFFFKSSLTITN